MIFGMLGNFLDLRVWFPATWYFWQCIYGKHFFGDNLPMLLKLSIHAITTFCSTRQQALLHPKLILGISTLNFSTGRRIFSLLYIHSLLRLVQFCLPWIFFVFSFRFIWKHNSLQCSDDLFNRTEHDAERGSAEQVPPPISARLIFLHRTSIPSIEPQPPPPPAPL